MLATVLIILSWMILMLGIFIRSEYPEKWDKIGNIGNWTFDDIEEEFTNPDSDIQMILNKLDERYGHPIPTTSDDNDKIPLSDKQRVFIADIFLPELYGVNLTERVLIEDHRLAIHQIITILQRIIIKGEYSRWEKKILNYLRRRKMMGAFPF